MADGGGGRQDRALSGGYGRWCRPGCLGQRRRRFRRRRLGERGLACRLRGDALGSFAQPGLVGGDLAAERPLLSTCFDGSCAGADTGAGSGANRRMSRRSRGLRRHGHPSEDCRVERSGRVSFDRSMCRHRIGRAPVLMLCALALLCLDPLRVHSAEPVDYATQIKPIRTIKVP